MKKNKIIIFTIIIVIIFIKINIITIIYILNNNKLKEIVYLEAGTISKLDINLFFKNNKSYNSTFETNIDEIDLNKVGSHIIKVKYKNKIKSVKLLIQDTTKPNVIFKDVNAGLNYEFNPNDFIVSINDVSEVIIETKKAPNNLSIGLHKVVIIVKDIYNNITSKTCNLNIQLTKSSLEIELGNKITLEDIFYDSKNYGYLLAESILEMINNYDVGNYQISINYENKENITNLIIKDTTPPNLNLKNLTIYKGEKINDIYKFVNYVSDASNYNLTYETEINYNTLKSQTIKIKATDKYNNYIVKEATLNIIEDKTGPTFSGLTNIIINKNENIDYLKGVIAKDDKDGIVDFTVDSSSVQTNNYGTYYVLYTAYDKSKNKTTSKRKIIINYDETDRKNAIETFAKTCNGSFENIRLCVQKYIKYNGNEWGGEDPIWYGLTTKKGNCYVYATLYQEVLKFYGYENMLIWTTDKTHYWNLVKIEGKWYHSDSSPGKKHGHISMVNDEIRYQNLQGRDWDRTAWPSAI